MKKDTKAFVWWPKRKCVCVWRGGGGGGRMLEHNTNNHSDTLSCAVKSITI